MLTLLEFINRSNRPHLATETIPESILKILLRTVDETDTAKPIERPSTDLVNILNSIEPVIPSQQGSYAYGPFAFSNVSPLTKSDHQKNVSEKLSRKLRQILKDRYSLYG